MANLKKHQTVKNDGDYKTNHKRKFRGALDYTFGIHQIATQMFDRPQYNCDFVKEFKMNESTLPSGNRYKVAQRLARTFFAEMMGEIIKDVVINGNEFCFADDAVSIKPKTVILPSGEIIGVLELKIGKTDENGVDEKFINLSLDMDRRHAVVIKCDLYKKLQENAKKRFYLTEEDWIQKIQRVKEKRKI